MIKTVPCLDYQGKEVVLVTSSIDTQLLSSPFVAETMLVQPLHTKASNGISRITNQLLNTPHECLVDGGWRKCSWCRVSAAV